MKYQAAMSNRNAGGSLIAWFLFALAGCATPKATSVSSELPFEQAVIVAVDGLVSQTQTLPGFLNKVESKLGKREVVVDPMIDAGSGQQTGVTTLLEKQVGERLTTSYNQFALLAFQATNLKKAEYLLTGTTTSATGRGGSKLLRINLALTELKGGNVVAQSSAVARDTGLDNSPTAFYRDTPVVVNDRLTTGYIRTSAMSPGQRADTDYLDHVATATVIAQATNLYNAERYEESLGQYKTALAAPAGEQMRTLSGIYLTNWKLGRGADAEKAFLKMVQYGIAHGTLGVKFLFSPGNTSFWPDPTVSGPYPMWLRQIAHEAAVAKVCMEIVGHTSHTGSEQVNDQLSMQRASFIKQRLEAESAELAGRTRSAGRGFRENMIGAGTDDVRDALDRRVEFKIVPCT